MGKPKHDLTKDRYPRGIDNAIDALRENMKRPLFVPPSRRYIPMRHKALARLLGGDMHPGLPTGCFVEVMGQASSGKTTLTKSLIEAVVNQPEDAKQVVIGTTVIEEIPAPRKALVLDFEQTEDVKYTESCCRNGVVLRTDDKGKPLNVKDANIYIHQPEVLEEGAEVMMHMIGSAEFGIVVLDSIPAMLSADEQAMRFDENTMGLLARSLGKFFRKSVHLIRRYGVTVVLINQWREKIGVSFGDPRATPGGKAGEYFDSIKLDVSGPKHTPWFDHGKTCNIKTLKNKVTGHIGLTASYALEHGRGLSAEAEVTEHAMGCGIVEWNGRSNARVRLRKVPKQKVVREYTDLPAWFEALRESDKLLGQVWALCDRAGSPYAKLLSGKDKGEWVE